MNGDSKIVVKNMGGGTFGILWPIGWLFTIGFCHLAMKQGIFAIVIWPYYLGIALKH